MSFEVNHAKLHILNWRIFPQIKYRKSSNRKQCPRLKLKCSSKRPIIEPTTNTSNHNRQELSECTLSIESVSERHFLVNPLVNRTQGSNTTIKRLHLARMLLVHRYPLPPTCRHNQTTLPYPHPFNCVPSLVEQTSSLGA